MTEPTNDTQPPRLSQEALQEIYNKLREFYRDDYVQRIMRKLTNPSDQAFMAPEQFQNLRDELIGPILAIVMPIAWRDWQPSADVSPT